MCSLLCLSTLSESCILWEPSGSIAQGKTVKLKTSITSLHAAAGLPAAVAAHDCGGVSLVDASGIAASTAASGATAKKTALQWCRVLQLRGSHRGNWIAISALSHRSKGSAAKLKLVVSRIRSSGGTLSAQQVHAQDIQLPSAATHFSAAFNKAQLTLTVASPTELHFIAWPAQADWFSSAATLVASAPLQHSDGTSPAALYAVEPSSLLVATADASSSSMQLDMWNVPHRVPLAGCDITASAPLAARLNLTAHKQLSKVFLCAGAQIITVPFVPSRGALSQLVGCAPTPAGAAAGTPTLSFAAMLHHKAAVHAGKRGREGADWAAVVHDAAAAESKRARELCDSLAGGQAAPYGQLRHLGLASLGSVLEELRAAVAGGKCTGGHRDTLMSLLRAGSVSHELCPRLASALLAARELELLHAMLVHVPDLPEALLVAAVMAPLTASAKRVSAMLGSTVLPAETAEGEDAQRLSAVSRMLFQAVQCGRNDVALAAALRELDMDCTGILLGCLLSLRASSPASHPGYAASLDWARLTIDAQLPRLGQAARHATHIKDCLARWNEHVVAELSLCGASSGVAGPLLHVLEKAPVPAPVSGDYVVCADFF